jgi:acetyl-CoA acetyltransferase family protein
MNNAIGAGISDERDPVIVAAARTPIGRGHRERGWLRDVHPNELLGIVYRAVIDRAEVEPQMVEDVVSGTVNQIGAQGSNIARTAWLQAGLPETTAATTVDRKCGSGQQAISFAAALIAAGYLDIAIGAGVEHMGLLPIGSPLSHPEEFGSPFTAALEDRYELVSQGVAADLVADSWAISREEQDAVSARSHRRAARAVDEGRFDREIVAVPTAEGDVAADQGIRRDTNEEVLATLPAAFQEGGTITAGNSSQISDGAAAILLASAERAEQLGLRPRARIVDAVAVGVDPVTMLTGPIPATRKLLERNQLTVDDLDVVEVNEAFASVIGAWQRELSPNMDRVNVNGGAIALGHPLGASGARLVTTLVHELERSGGRLGLVTMCTAGGQGTATLIERL